MGQANWVEPTLGDIPDDMQRRIALYVVEQGRTVEERKMFLEMLGISIGSQAIEG